MLPEITGKRASYDTGSAPAFVFHISYISEDLFLKTLINLRRLFC